LRLFVGNSAGGWLNIETLGVWGSTCRSRQTVLECLSTSTAILAQPNYPYANIFSCKHTSEGQQECTTKIDVGGSATRRRERWERGRSGAVAVTEMTVACRMCRSTYGEYGVVGGRERPLVACVGLWGREPATGEGRYGGHEAGTWPEAGKPADGDGHGMGGARRCRRGHG
jgi:hypothetical protein